MLKSYVKIAWRNLRQNRLYTTLIVGGLSVGLTACLLMFLYVKHEFTYDGHYQHAERIARITTDLTLPEAPLSVASCPIMLADMVARSYPEVQTAARFEPLSAVVGYRDKLLNQSEVYYADQAAFRVFSYRFVAGDTAQALSRPNSAVVTAAFARKYMGHTNAVGELIQCNKKTYQVTGVIADLPSNTDMRISALLSKDFSTSTTWLGEDFPAYTFILFRHKPDLPAFERKLVVLSQRYIQPEFKQLGAAGCSVRFKVEPLHQVHFSQGKMADMPKGNRQYGYVFAFLAVFVFAIALLNYINLVTARATSRAKEVGIRKATGAIRSQLIGQFLLESLLLSLLVGAVGVGLLLIVIPAFSTFLQIQLTVSIPDGLMMIGMVVLATTLLGGLYPAFVLSGYQSANVLRGRFGSRGEGAWLRRGITVFQFILTIGMIDMVLFGHRQLNYLQQASLGFTPEQVLTLALPEDSLARASAAAFANALRQQSQINDVTIGSGLQSDALLPIATTVFTSGGKKKERASNYLFIDERFVPLLHIHMAAGRNLTNTFEAEKTGDFLVNEAFVRLAGWQHAIGQDMEGFGHKGKVVGVVKNFHYRSLHNLIEPLVLIYKPSTPSSITVKLRPESLGVVEATWKKYYPAFPLEYAFLDASLAAQYQKDRLLMALFNGFALLTIVISCLGLVGLTAYTIERRTQEIGIRKVLGGSVASIVTLLSNDLLKLVAIALVIASPLAWWVMQQWLQDFAYKITVDCWVFALAGLLAILIAFTTISFQSIKAALANPVKSLRSE